MGCHRCFEASQFPDLSSVISFFVFELVDLVFYLCIRLCLPDEMREVGVIV